jgi:hypothetical protein
LPGDKPEVGLVAVAAQLGEGQHALVDAGRFGRRRRRMDLRGRGGLIGRGRRFGCISLGLRQEKVVEATAPVCCICFMKRDEAI